MSKKHHKTKQNDGPEEHNTKCSMQFRDTHHVGRKTLKLWAINSRDHREKRHYTKHLRVQRRA